MTCLQQPRKAKADCAVRRPLHMGAKCAQLSFEMAEDRLRLPSGRGDSERNGSDHATVAVCLGRELRGILYGIFQNCTTPSVNRGRASTPRLVSMPKSAGADTP